MFAPQATRPHINLGMSQKRTPKRSETYQYIRRPLASCPRISVASGSAGCCFDVARPPSATCFLCLTVFLLYDSEGHVRDPGLGQAALLELDSFSSERSLESNFPLWTDGKAEVGRIRKEKERRKRIREEKESEARRYR